MTARTVSSLALDVSRKLHAQAGSDGTYGRIGCSLEYVWQLKVEHGIREKWEESNLRCISKIESSFCFPLKGACGAASSAASVVAGPFLTRGILSSPSLVVQLSPICASAGICSVEGHHVERYPCVKSAKEKYALAENYKLFLFNRSRSPQ